MSLHPLGALIGGMLGGVYAREALPRLSPFHQALHQLADQQLASYKDHYLRPTMLSRLQARPCVNCGAPWEPYCCSYCKTTT